MTQMPNPKIPAFSSLPLRPDGPHGNAWGLFGADDNIGRLNLLTPETTKAAIGEIQDGVRISTDWPLDGMRQQPCFGRKPFEQTIINKAPRSVNDDVLVLNTQISSQWDGFRHYGYQKERLYYNGVTLEDLLGSNVNGIHAWAEKGGIVGRGVLLDYAAWAAAQNISVDCFSATSITVSQLKEIAATQKTTFQQGDILLIRTGWIQAYNQLTTEARQALADNRNPPAIGIESSEETLKWVWEQGFAAVAGDQPSLEAWPCQNTDFWLHEWFLAGWGLPIGELFDLERLSQECRQRGKWSFFFSSVPLKVPGGVASPPNGVAIL